MSQCCGFLGMSGLGIRTQPESCSFLLFSGRSCTELVLFLHLKCGNVFHWSYLCLSFFFARLQISFFCRQVLWFSISSFYFGTGDRTSNLTLARQLLTPLSNPRPSPSISSWVNWDHFYFPRNSHSFVKCVKFSGNCMPGPVAVKLQWHSFSGR